MLQNALNDTVNKRIRKWSSFTKVSHPCLDDHQFKQEELESVGELSEVCSQIVLKCLYLARIGRPDILWSVNKLARSVTSKADLTEIVESGYGPNQFDNFDYSETLAAIFQNESVDIDTEPSYSCDAELDDELIGKALSSPLFTQEREEPANQTQTCHSHEESLLPAKSFITRTSTERPVYEPGSNLCQKRKSSRDLENERIRILLDRQMEQIHAEVRSEIQMHELQAESDKRSIHESSGVVDCHRMEIDHTTTGRDQSTRDQPPLQEELSEQNRALRKIRIRNMRDMEELQKSHVLKVKELSRRKLTEDQNSMMELRANNQV